MFVKEEAHLRCMTTAELFDVYDGTLRQIADTHAPASSTVRRLRRLSPWFDKDCRQARCKSRLFEIIQEGIHGGGLSQDVTGSQRAIRTVILGSHRFE